MSDSLSPFTKPRAAPSLTAEDEHSLLDEGATSEFGPAETIADGDEDNDSAVLLPYQRFMMELRSVSTALAPKSLLRSSSLFCSVFESSSGESRVVGRLVGQDEKS